MNITFSTQPADEIITENKRRVSSSKSRAFGCKTIVAVILLACSMAVFLFGTNYYELFPTNGNSLYAGSISAIFLIAALAFKRSRNQGKYWPVVYAFFVASMVNLVSALLAGYGGSFVSFLGASMDTNAGLALEKLYDALLVVGPILLLSLAARVDLRELYLKIGNLSYKLGFGIGSLVLVNYFTSVLIFFGTGYAVSQLGAVIVWGLVFSLSNSLLEELWVRGLFLRKLVPLVGAVGAVVLTSIWFAAMHFISVAYLPAVVVPIFVVNTFTLGLACGILMLKTDSIWGAFLIHAAADLFLFIAILAVR